MRQLFTSAPFSNTEQEPHSPSPHPSLAPVNPNWCRSMSSNLSMGYARTVLNSPFTVNDISHAEGFSDDKDWVIALRRRLAARDLPLELRRYLLEAEELNRIEL